MDDINAKIDLLLAERRPDRYEKEGGDGWLDEIADDIEPLISETDARSLLATSLVRQREGSKTRAANQAIRQLREPQQPLDGWWSMQNLPIKVGKERVAFRAATSVDLRQFAQDERRSASQEHVTREQTCTAAEWLADLMDGQGIVAAADLDLGEAEAA